MKDRKKRGPLFSWRTCFLYTLFILVFSGFTFPALRLFFRADGFHPKLVPARSSAAMEAISGESTDSPTVFIQETVIFPEQALVFLKYPPATPLFTKDDISCIYFSPNSSSPPKLKVAPMSTDDDYFGSQIVRCPLPPGGMIASLAVKSNGNLLSGPTLRWDSLAYEALIDRDKTTIVFVKGFNLRGGRTSDPSKFKCVYGYDLKKPNIILRSDVISIAQEIVRCRTPLTILNALETQSMNNDSIKVSVRLVGRRTLESIARPAPRFASPLPTRKPYQMCVCTMLRNQARFLREWVMYHGQIGVERWFIYDNNSDDEIESVIESLNAAYYNITRHVWPWIKTQEAGFAHCALRARETCEWVGFTDVDEYFHLPSGLSLPEVIGNHSTNRNVAEIRSMCHNFGPSGLKEAPVKGVTVGYTCRMNGLERHKSIVRPEGLNSTLINVVHHFHLKPGYESVTMDINRMVINHYKYQVWEVFKEKFYRRVATYVSDWQQDQNVGSKDRTPGLGTRAIEPSDWSSRFCDVQDTGLRDRVLKTFTDPKTGLLPWQDQPADE